MITKMYPDSDLRMHEYKDEESWRKAMLERLDQQTRIIGTGVAILAAIAILLFISLFR